MSSEASNRKPGLSGATNEQERLFRGRGCSGPCNFLDEPYFADRSRVPGLPGRFVLLDSASVVELVRLDPEERAV